MHDDKINLLQETLAALTSIGHTPVEIVYIGTDPANDPPHYACTWKQFEKLADHVYDAGYGAPKVATDLVIILSNGDKLERAEYDGAEWWRPQINAPLPTTTRPIRRIIGDLWPTLATLHGKQDD